MQCKYCGDYDTLAFLIIDDKVLYKCSNCKNELLKEELEEDIYDIEELEVDYGEKENMSEMLEDC